MYFITCFDSAWMQNQRWFSGIETPPRDESGRVMYLNEAHRCFGYYPTKEEALRAVRANRCDLQECRYSWCVVEHVPAGIHAYSEEETVWFKWVSGEGRHVGKWTETERPKETERLIGFGVG